MVNSSKYFSIEGSDPDSYIAAGHEVLIVALDENGNVFLTIEPAPAYNGLDVLILPGGTWEPGEDASATANRELQEEVGQQGTRFDEVGEVWRWAKYLTVHTLVYLVRDLSPHKLAGDEHYDIKTETVPLARFEDLMASGRLRDAATIAALYMARTHVDREQRDHATS